MLREGDGDLALDHFKVEMTELSYIILNFDELDEKFYAERIGNSESQIIEPVDLLPLDDCRFLLFKKEEKIEFIKWDPDLASKVRKDVFQSSANQLIKLLSSVLGLKLDLFEESVK